MYSRQPISLYGHRTRRSTVRRLAAPVSCLRQSSSSSRARSGFGLASACKRAVVYQLRRLQATAALLRLEHTVAGVPLTCRVTQVRADDSATGTTVGVMTERCTAICKNTYLLLTYFFGLFSALHTTFAMHQVHLSANSVHIGVGK